jgi:hypothetical protein
MPNLYKRAFDKITVPSETVEKTALSLERARRGANGANGAYAAAQARRARYRRLAFACVAAAVILPILIFTFMSDTGIFITKLEKGKHAEQVELKDGFLSFRQDSGVLITAPRLLLGSPGIRREEWDSERYMEYLGVDAPSGYLPQGMVLEEESIVVYLSASGNILSDCLTRNYISGDGALQISASKGTLPPQCNPGWEENSVIKDNPLAAGISQNAAIYWAQFIHGGAGYYIESSGISQEEFIKTLHSFFD